MEEKIQLYQTNELSFITRIKEVEIKVNFFLFSFISEHFFFFLYDEFQFVRALIRVNFRVNTIIDLTYYFTHYNLLQLIMTY